MMEKITELQDRLDQVTSDYTEVKGLCADLQMELKRSNEDVDLYRKVVDIFWRVREQAIGSCETKHIQERATILLQDDETIWSYGEMNIKLHNEAEQAKGNLAILQDEFQVCCASLENFQAQLEKENTARKQAEEALSDCRQHLSCLSEVVNSELRQLSSAKANLKEDIAAFLMEEKKWIFSLPETLQPLTKEGSGISAKGVNGDVEQQETSETVILTSSSAGKSEHEVSAPKEGFFVQSPELDPNEEAAVSTNQVIEPVEDSETEELVTRPVNLDPNEETSVSNNQAIEPVKDSDLVIRPVNLDDTADSRIVVVENHMQTVDDSKEALAQALQEKVSALLLLSQQEERHILESNTAVALESEISTLKEQLSQVTSEKVDALVELARAHEELLKLQEQETFKQSHHYNRTPSSGNLSPVGDHGVFFEGDWNSGLNGYAERTKKPSVQGYLRNLWLKAPELGARTKSLSHMLTLRVSKESDPVGIARLRVENATLRESLISIRHLCKSANRLRLTIARVAAESSAQTESSIQAAVDAVDGVISEALHLKVALHSSLPVDDLGWNSIGSPLARASETSEEGSDNETNDDLDIVSFFGLEIVRLVLLAAQLQKRFLGQNV